MTTKKIFIVGSGLMGSGIAQVCAQSSIDVLLYDVDPAALNEAVKNIEWSIDKFIEKGKLKEDKTSIIGRIKTVAYLSDASKADLIIEAVFENLKQSHRTMLIPVILISAFLLPKELEAKGIELGAEGSISKPFESKELIAKVKKILG